MVNAEQLRQLKIDTALVDPFNETFERFGIVTPAQQASWIGQCGHECGNFRIMEENLNYRAPTLLKLFPQNPKRVWGFTPESAAAYEKQPQKIANRIYGNRMGNRDEASGDGFRFRGSGFLQLTGHSNFYHAGQALGVDFVMQPELVRTPRYAAQTAGWFWQTHRLNQYADSGDILTMTKRINGGTIGLEDRKKHIEHALHVLGG
jgi:putative chitinase